MCAHDVINGDEAMFDLIQRLVFCDERVRNGNNLRKDYPASGKDCACCRHHDSFSGLQNYMLALYLRREIKRQVILDA